MSDANRRRNDSLLAPCTLGQGPVEPRTVRSGMRLSGAAACPTGKMFSHHKIVMPSARRTAVNTPRFLPRGSRQGLVFLHV